MKLFAKKEKSNWELALILLNYCLKDIKDLKGNSVFTITTYNKYILLDSHYLDATGRISSTTIYIDATGYELKEQQHTDYLLDSIFIIEYISHILKEITLEKYKFAINLLNSYPENTKIRDIVDFYREQIQKAELMNHRSKIYYGLFYTNQKQLKKEISSLII